MVLHSLSTIKENKVPLRLESWPDPEPGAGQVLIKVSTCGVCHTELDEIEGRTPPPILPIIPGHQVIGRIKTVGVGVNKLSVGQRVGVAWIFWACGKCSFCLGGNENLCNNFKATGKDAHGGYAEYMVVPAQFTIPIPDKFSDSEAAPLLCAGAIGYRALQLANLNDGRNFGLVGFGASAHLVLQMVKYLYPKTQVFVFVRDKESQEFALKLGANWAGNITDTAPIKLRAIIDTTPAWSPIISALKNLEAGGRLVINAIRKEEDDKRSLLKLNYPEDLWLEKEIKSVANITRADVTKFVSLAAEIPIKPTIQLYDLDQANRALIELKTNTVKGAKVLKI